MSFFNALFLVCAIAIALLGALALLVWMEKKLPSKKFDERQQIVQGKAYKWAFLVGFCYFIVVAFLDMVLPSGVQADPLLIVMVGISLEVFVLACYCIVHDAYTPLTKSPKADIILMYILGAVQLFNAADQVDTMAIILEEDYVHKMDFSEVVLSATGESAFVWAQLMVAVMLLVVATVELIRYMWNSME